MRTAWTPLGTVRRRLGAPQPKATPWPEWLVDAARRSGIGDDAVYRAWELARTEVDATPVEREALIAIGVIASSVVGLEGGGSTYVDLEELPERLKALGAKEELVAASERLLQSESHVIGRPGDYKPLIVDGSSLYLQRVHAHETELARKLKERLGAKVDRGDYMKILDALDRVLAHRAVVEGRVVRPSAGQQHAVRTALTQSFTVISGGPGSGKTSIIVSILRVLARLDFTLDDVVLAAPTGRAARRMAESVELGFAAVPEPKIVDAAVIDALPKPATLHRLLGYSPARGRYRYHETHRLPQKLVIVDEASMIDLELMGRLLGAVRRDARLVLLGDRDQLPPVGVGAVFADVVALGHERASVHLEGNYRVSVNVGVNPKNATGKALATAFDAIRSGEPGAIRGSLTERGGAGEVEFRGVEILETDHDAFLARWFRERVMTPEYRKLAASETIDEAAVFAHLRSHGVLTVTNRDAERVNRAFARDNPTRIGEPVVAPRNDYERGLFNGERGVVTPSGVRFESGVSAPGAFSDELLTAYALTVHKSQGAELDHVVLVLPVSAEHPLLTRELLYTAITRARRSVTILGSREAVVAGAGRTVRRRTGILTRLA